MKNDIPSKRETDIAIPISKRPFPSPPHTLLGRLGVIFICLAIVMTTAMSMVACERVEANPAPTETPSDTTEANSLPSESPHFTFGYEPFGGFAIPGDLIYINAYVVNEGSPFTYEGSSRGFAPTATLVHRESGYRIQGNYATTMDLVRFTVNTKDKGQANQIFAIPTSAPTGEYDLYLSFNGQEQIFENVLTVAIP